MYGIVLGLVKANLISIHPFFKNHTTLQQVTISYPDGHQENLDLDDYLIGVVAGEMPITFEDEAIKAQIVASRTYVISRNYQVDTTTKTQVYLTKQQMQENWQDQYDKNYEHLKMLVQQTTDEVLTYQGEYISALFFSSSNGYTENSEDYFQASAKPYLRSVKSPFEQDTCPNLIRTKNFSFTQINVLFGFIVDSIEIQSYYESHHVKSVKVNDQIYSGRQIRELLQLASTDFTITQDNQGYTFMTMGSGHGVGMSQYGANGMALLGYSYQEILQYYYQGVEITKI